MAEIRLNKLCRQFNVGLQPLVDFLNYMGAQVEFNPNSKVSDEYLPALHERFGRDMELSKAADATLIRLKDIVGDKDETEHSEQPDGSQEQPIPSGESDLKVIGSVDLSQFAPRQVKKRERIKSPVVKKFEPKVVDGTIITIKPQHCFVDVGLPIFAFIPTSEFRDFPNLKKGSVVPILIEDPGTITGHVKASYIKAKELKKWGKLETAYENADVITGYVKYKKSSGFAVDVFSHEAFLPYSLVELKPITEYDVYLNKEVKVKIVELDREKNRIILSRKDVLRQEEESRPEHLIQEIWKEHLNLQQKQLELKKRPIKVDRSSSKLYANTLQLTLDKRSSVDGFVELVRSKYGLEDSCFSEQDGYNVITIPASNEMSLDSDLVNKASAARIQLTSNPSIYGTLSSNDQVLTDLFEEMGEDNQYDSSGRSQVTLDVLARLQEYYSALQQPVSLPDTASIILRCEPNLEYVLREE
ncbi:MAG: S1 RNA-binding domain-containing protein, partial [Bacteroidales bacterium]|nr:S1 RNA-binding domain-containing protein [Bacteroidales bacterium]